MRMKHFGWFILSLGFVVCVAGAYGIGSDVCHAATMRAAVGGEGGCYCQLTYIHPECDNDDIDAPPYTCSSCSNLQHVPNCCHTYDEERYCDRDGGGGFNCGQVLLCTEHDEDYTTCWGCYMQQSMCATGWKCSDL